MSKTAIVIVNYNDFVNTSELIVDIKNYAQLSNIIVVDNGSTDLSGEQLEEYADDQVRLLRSTENLGYARGNNLGMRYAIRECGAEYLFIANPDVRFDEEVLEGLLIILEQDGKKTGVVTARMDSKKAYAGCGVWKLPTIGNLIFNNLLILKKLFGDRTYYKADELQEALCKVDVVAGSFFACKADVMVDIGFFDEATFLYCEENILACKLKAQGYTNYLCRDYSYRHEHSASIDKNVKNLKRKFMLLYQSMLYYNKQYLHTNRFEDMMYEWSFYLGLYVHLLLKRILSK